MAAQPGKSRRRVGLRVRGVPGNGRPRARRLAAGTLGAALIGGGPTGVGWAGPAAASLPLARPAATAAAAPSPAQGYTLLGGDGGVFNFRTNFYGSMFAQYLAASIVGGAAMPDGSGYWLVGRDGGVFAFGGAPFKGSLSGIKLQSPIVGITPTADGRGYWLAGADGGIFAFGDARYSGNLIGTRLGGSIVGIAGDGLDDSGYWLAGADGGVFGFGPAAFRGSAVHDILRGPIVGITAAPDGNGYWLAGDDGGVFAFGSGGFHGSRGTAPGPFNVVGILSTPSGNGYWLACSDGTLYRFGDAKDLGSLAGDHLTAPVVGITGRAPATGVSAFMGSYPRPLWAGVTTDTGQGGLGGDDTPTFTGGPGPYTAALAAGTHLPPGLLLESDGTLRGDAAIPGTFTVVFTDAKGDHASVPVSVGYAPTGYIATLAGGQRSSTDSGTSYGRTTLPAADGHTVAQGPGTTYPGDPGDGGASTGSQVFSPNGVAVGPDGTIYFAEIQENAQTGSRTGSDIRDITPDGIIHTFTGTGGTTPTTSGTPLDQASFSYPAYVAVDGQGDVIIGDSNANQIYVIPAKSGTYYDVDMEPGYVWPITGTGTATPAIGQLSGMTVAPDGTLYWSDATSDQVESFGIGDASPSTVVTSSTATADGTDPLGTPLTLAVDPASGTLYLSNSCTNCNGDVVDELTPVDGTPTLTDVTPGYRYGVAGLAVDASHDLYISDDFGFNGTGAKTVDNEVLRVRPGAGTPQVVAGTPPSATPNSNTFTSAGYQNGVPATSTGVDAPGPLAYDPLTNNLTVVQAPGPWMAGVGAKAVRIVSNPAAAAGGSYTPGPQSSPA
ncbi:MAG TPA: hypothetical protein VFH58_03155 [Acidimicrobiales bacterium]|nr:hypothetical protein [Acidimicrobiales bacterium]